MKRFSLFFFISLIVFLYACSGDDSHLSKDIRTPSLIVKKGYILAFDDAGYLWQWATNKVGEPLDSTKVKIDIANPVEAGFVAGALAWAVNASGKGFSWELSEPSELTKVKTNDKIVSSPATENSYAQLFGDGTLLSINFLIGREDTLWQNLTDVALTDDILIGCTKEGTVKITGMQRTYVDKILDTLRNIERVGTYKRSAGWGTNRYNSQCYVVDTAGYFYFFDPHYRYIESFAKSSEPSLWYFDGFQLQKDGDIVTADGKPLPQWEIPIPDSTYYFKRVYYDRHAEMRYSVRKDGSFTYTKINHPLRNRVRYPKAGETKTVEGFRFALSPFES